MSQDDLAKRLGWHRSRIAKIESGERRAGVAEFITIARALSLDPEQPFINQAALTMTLPKFRPSSLPMKAFGAASRPSTICSR